MICDTASISQLPWQYLGMPRSNGWNLCAWAAWAFPHNLQPIGDGQKLDTNHGKHTKKRWKTTIFELGKSTISTGPCSIANCNKLPEGKFGGFSIFFVVSQFFGKISMFFPFFFRGTTKSSENLRFCYCLKSHWKGPKQQIHRVSSIIWLLLTVSSEV